MQDLMNLLNEQSKVISSLQRTIEGLNETIKSLNDKVQRFEAPKGVNVIKEVGEEVFVGVVNKEVTENGAIDINEANKISINVATSSKNAHLKTVHENFQPSKCQGGSSERSGTSHLKTVHENENVTVSSKNVLWNHTHLKLVHENIMQKFTPIIMQHYNYTQVTPG